MTTKQFETTALNENNSKVFSIIKDLAPFNNALDIGACVGNFTKFLAKYTKGTVYAFEPSTENYLELLYNTHKLENIVIYECAISDNNNPSTLHICPNDPGMNRLYPSKWCEGGKTKHVATRRIDSFRTFSRHNPPKIDFVKIDVEGWEYHVLIGMRELLLRDHPILLMEFHPPSIEEAGDNPINIWNFLMNTTMNYCFPMNCETGEVIHTYEELDKQTRNSPAVNLLFI